MDDLGPTIYGFRPRDVKLVFFWHKTKRHQKLGIFKVKHHMLINDEMRAFFILNVSLKLFDNQCEKNW